MASYGFIKILSNDGSETLVLDIQVDAWEPVISVTGTGLKQGTAINYVYSGNKKFLGVSTTPNATEPTYAVGGEYTLPRIESLATFSLYIVEGEANTSTITNLENTTWYIDYYTYTGTTQDYIVSGELVYSGGSVDLPYPSSLRLSSSSLSFGNGGWDDNISISYPDWCVIRFDSVSVNNGSDLNIITILFNEYGTQLKVDDLTDTTWNVSARWEAEAGYGQFNVNFSKGSLTDGSNFDIGYYRIARFSASPQANTIALAFSGVYDAVDSTPNDELLGITFTDGPDTTNPKLIAWLSKYGELQGGEVEPTLTYDLSQLDLAAGTHSITVRAKADGYADSEPSNAVEYVVEDSTLPKTYNLSIVNGSMANITSHTAPSTITEGETVTFTVSSGPLFTGYTYAISYTPTASINYEQSGGTSKPTFTFTVSNPTDDVVITFEVVEGGVEEPPAPDLV